MEDLGIAKKRVCKWCKKATLKCIGRQRKNGDVHFDDWDKRDLHKKCMPRYESFLELQRRYLKPEDWIFK